MTQDKKKDVAASVRQRLLNQSRETGQDFQRVLVRYGVERLLYRLSQSPERQRFVLKGAMLFAAWTAAPFRATGDLDLLGFGPDDLAAAGAAFIGLCQLPLNDGDNDGLIFVPESVAVTRTRDDEDYRGLHVRLDGKLKNTIIPILIDIGFGDAVHPAPVDIDYPRLLTDVPAANIRAYPPETVIAEKFDAMVRFDGEASRLKDHYDIWAISETFPFKASMLVEAVRGTLRQRGRAVPTTWPACLLLEFAERADKIAQWNAFLNRSAPALEPPAFVDLLERVRVFLDPVLQGLQAGSGVSTKKWHPGSGWRA